MGLLNDGKLLTYIYNRANKTIEFVFREICFGPDSVLKFAPMSINCIITIITLEGFKKI